MHMEIFHHASAILLWYAYYFIEISSYFTEIKEGVTNNYQHSHINTFQPTPLRRGEFGL